MAHVVKQKYQEQNLPVPKHHVHDSTANYCNAFIAMNWPPEEDIERLGPGLLIQGNNSDTARHARLAGLDKPGVRIRSFTAASGVEKSCFVRFAATQSRKSADNLSATYTTLFLFPAWHF